MRSELPKPQRRVWQAGTLRVELDMEWSGGPIIGIDGFTTTLRPHEVPALVAALLDAADQIKGADGET